MSKLVAVTVATGGATVVTVGGTYVLNRGSEAGNGVSLPTNPAPAQPATPAKPTPDSSHTQSVQDNSLEFEDLTKFKSAHGGKCAESVFSDKNIDFDVSVTNVDPVSDSFFGNAPDQDTSDSTKGCLSISGLKESVTTPTNKWKGTFTGTWAFVNGNKGFITFNVAKTKEAGKQLDFTGGAYLLDNVTTGSTSKGTVKWKQEETGSGQKKVDSKDFDSKFPKAKSGTAVQINQQNYGGFIEGSSKLTEISDDVTGATPTHENKKWSGTWKKGSTNKVGEWSDNLEWGKHIYGDSVFDLNTKLSSFVGDWSVADSPTNTGS